ncbi:hypothetical protein BH11CYA1_BH11CYA1_10010 [soil metagenome]
MNLKSILMTIGVCVSVCSSAQGATIDKEFLNFWQDFKAALQKNDKDALASMTKLPYGLDEKKLNRASFIAQSEKIFPSATRKCLLKEKPVADKDSVLIFCGEQIFVFAKDHGKYKFTEIGVND